MKLEDQVRFLEAAAAAVHLVSTRELPAHGAIVRCLSSVLRVQEIEAGKKQDKFKRRKRLRDRKGNYCPKAEPENRWQKLGESINAVIDEAGTSPRSGAPNSGRPSYWAIRTLRGLPVWIVTWPPPLAFSFHQRAMLNNL